MSFKVIIPARMSSTRLPGKPLLEIAGKPMLQHVYERAIESGAETIIIATDDERIETAARGFGAEVCMTGEHHRSGSERLAEVVEKLGMGDDEIVVNLQGDEPLIPAALIRQVGVDMARHTRADVTTLCTRIHTAAELFDPHVVKVVMDKHGNALYFSRAVIPWDRDAFAISTDELPENALHYRHLGLYAYRAAYIKAYVKQAHCALEQMESLEQLRVLWHGGRIHVAQTTEPPGHGVDTEADLARVRALFEVQ